MIDKSVYEQIVHRQRQIAQYARHKRLTGGILTGQLKNIIIGKGIDFDRVNVRVYQPVLAHASAFVGVKFDHLVSASGRAGDDLNHQPWSAGET